MLAQSADAQALEKTVIEGYNSKLADRAAALKTAHPDVTVWVWDSAAIFTTILDDPTTGG